MLIGYEGVSTDDQSLNFQQDALQAVGCDRVFSDKMSGGKIDTTTSGSKLIFHVFSALAEFERNLIREQTQAGLQAASPPSRSGGRRQKLTPEQIAIGRSLATEPTRSVASICQHLNISCPTFYWYIHPELTAQGMAMLTMQPPTIKTTQARL